jgi:hypothetical protein
MRHQPNMLIVTYEEMVNETLSAVRYLAAHMNVELTEVQMNKVVTYMDKKWALEHVDPYLYAAKTPFSPPDRDK